MSDIITLLLNILAQISQDQGYLLHNHSKATTLKKTNIEQAFILQLILKFYKLPGISGTHL